MGWAGKIKNKSKKLSDFSAQHENGWYESLTVSRPVPALPYHVFVPFTIFPE
jgi:hypothetical protein